MPTFRRSSKNLGEGGRRYAVARRRTVRPIGPPRQGLTIGASRLLRWARIGAAAWAISIPLLIVLGVWEASGAERRLRGLEKNLTPSALLEDSTLDVLAEARDSLRRSDLLLNNPLIAPLKLFPFIGRQVRSLSAQPGAAATVVSVSHDSLKQAREVLRGPRLGAEERIETISRISSIAGHARTRLEGLDLGPSEALISPIAKRRERLIQKIEEAKKTLESAMAVAEGLESFLTGPRRYLITAANNAEMRAGSGMFLSWGTLETQNGSFSVKGLSSRPPFPPQGVPMDSDIEARWGWAEPNREWRNLGLSPRFDANAELAQRMWLASAGEPVDGLISIDVRALRHLLSAIGPVEVEGQQIDSKNVERIILHDQYLVGTDTESRAARQERGARIAATALERLNDGHWDLVTLLTELQRAVLGRHILIWSSNSDEQAAWEAMRADGSLAPNSLLVAVNNNGGNKLDQFLRVSGRLTTKSGPESTSVTLTLKLRNLTPLSAPAYVLGNEPPRGKGRGVYAGILSLSLPGQAAEPKVDRGSFSIYGPDGNSLVVGLQVVIPPGESETAVLTFLLPRAEQRLRVESSARIPPVSWEHRGASWVDDRPREIDLA